MVQQGTHEDKTERFPVIVVQELKVTEEEVNVLYSGLLHLIEKIEDERYLEPEDESTVRTARQVLTYLEGLK